MSTHEKGPGNPAQNSAPEAGHGPQGKAPGRTPGKAPGNSATKPARKPRPRGTTKPVSRRYVVGSSILSAGLLGAAAAVNVAASKFSSLLDHYLGGRPYTLEVAEGSEDWDSNYYDAQYRRRTEARAVADELVAEIEGEGAVLLKNDGTLPLPKGTKVSLLGRYAADPVYGGAGSGTVDPNECTDLYTGISDAGLAVNDAAYNWIKENYSNYPKANITMDSPETATYYIGEIPWADYSSDAQSSIVGTTGIVVVGRGGGEGGDLSTNLLRDVNDPNQSKFTANNETANYAEGQHELELTVEERDLIAAAKKACDKVVVLVNASTTMELGDLVSGDLEVNAILSIGSMGAAGSRGVGKILTGEVNPSGRTCDIWAADFTADPTFGNFGGKQYTDVSNYYPTNYNDRVSNGTAYFVEYEEGIYLGYRYYETAAVEAAAGNYAGFDYDKAVVFPFGYGLSYTTFEQTLDSCTAGGDEVKASVTVTNTGDVAGKQVVELYYTAPYEAGGPEKSAVVLGAFAKTEALEPGKSQAVELAFPVSSMASWDSTAKGGKGAYVLAAGDYVVSLRTDSHTSVAEATVTLAEQTYDTDPQTGSGVENRFADITEYMEQNCENLSRQDFAGTWPKAAEDKTAAECGIEFAEYDYANDLDKSVEMPTTGASNGLSLIDLRCLDYDDELWDGLLDQLSVDEMTTLLNDGAYNTGEVASISKPATSDPDGPAGFTSLTGSTGNCAYCSEYVMAQTWNVELMHRMGEMIGQEALACGYNGWYAPACNTHRSPFGGRNFEYYSEDPVLGGMMCAAVVSGAATNGVYAYVKHFAMNDQDAYRVQHICTWSTEQAAREIYLRPFELTVKNATADLKYISDDQGTVSTKTMRACTALMSSYNYIGTEWAGGRKSLLTDVLRGEWGFRGMVITDFNLYGYMEKNDALFGGTDLQLTYSAMTPAFEGTGEPSVVAKLRESTHNLLYTVVNSNAMQGMAPGTSVKYGTATWQYGVWGATAALVAGAAAPWIVAARRNGKAKAEAAAAETEATADASKG